MRRSATTNAGCDRHNIDDGTGLPLDHAGKKQFGNHKHALKVNVYDPISKFNGHINNIDPLAKCPGIVDQYIDCAAEAVKNLTTQGLYLISVTNIGFVLKYSEIIRPCPKDYYIRKHTHSAFFDTRLDSLLRNVNCETLVCVGFALDMCLGATMLDALWRNYRVLLLRDCTYAVEIPGIDQMPGAWTEHWVLYTECAIGYTATAENWITACEAVRKDELQAPS
jgi:hypothetical protein